MEPILVAEMLLQVEVIYALPDKQERVPLRLPAGSTLQQALEASGLLEKYPAIDLEKNKFGILPSSPGLTRCCEIVTGSKFTGP